jgi:hypothetical protein
LIDETGARGKAEMVETEEELDVTEGLLAIDMILSMRAHSLEQ